MKRYIKDGKIKSGNKIVVHLGGKQIINPKEEQILADGWVEYIIPTYTPTFNDLKSNKIQEILDYDSSLEVNEFFIGGVSVWLDKATRAGLSLRFQSEIALGETSTTLWYEGKPFTLSLDEAVKMLYALEVYASKCYDNTQYHISIINEYVTTEEELDAYDYRSGYPDKLYF